MRTLIPIFCLVTFLSCNVLANGVKPVLSKDKNPATAEKAKESKTLDYGSPKVKQKLYNQEMFVIKEVSKDKNYGYTVESPIMVGSGKDGMEGVVNERRFLNVLAGPKGEKVTYKRRGSGYSFKTKNGIGGGNSGMLDIYEVTYPGLEKPVVLYLNMYDSDTLKIPVGFTKKEVKKDRTQKPKK